MIFDTHLHLIDRSKLSYPWLSEVPALNQDASYDDYLSVAKRLGITSTLHMEVDVAEKDQTAETDMIEQLMQTKGGTLRGAIASCRPESEDFPAYLEKVAARGSVYGLRRVLHVVPDEISQSKLFRNNLNRLTNTSLTFDLCLLARQLKIGAALVDACPDVPFILDHCGVPDIAGGGYEPWAKDMKELSQRPNVTAKISGIIAYGDPQTWTLDTLRPYVEHTIECFGWDRVVWGSDSPVCTLGGNIELWVAATHALIAGCSADEKAKLLQDNAKQLWQLE
jgi:predicted TIM-barrel fold metal-dependent hydrolase